MKICYVPKSFYGESQQLILYANGILEEYMAEGYTLTVRQLYYQFVARALLANTERNYKRLVYIVNDARLAGLIDWEAIEDRTRNLMELPNWSDPTAPVKASAEQFKYDFWNTQPYYVEVWVEKEALVGVIERIANTYRLPFFACRGYTSQSETWRAGMRFKQRIGSGQKCVVLHLGDHDPSGIDMTRDNHSRLNLFAEDGVEVRRLALNIDQVREHRPPPNPAKLTDSRANDYVKRFGSQSWELDALDPKLISRLIEDAIRPMIDWEEWSHMMRMEESARAMIAQAAQWMQSEPYGWGVFDEKGKIVDTFLDKDTAKRQMEAVYRNHYSLKPLGMHYENIESID